VEVVEMDPPNGLVYQGELPFERDAVQCHSGRWRYVRLRQAPMDVVAESDSKEEVWRLARKLADRPVWEEHYEGMTLVGCVPPKGVYRDPQTCFLVTDGSPRPPKVAPEPDSHVRLKIMPEEAPETPRSAERKEERPVSWRLQVKKLIQKL
jgi:hypothetical protein